MDSRGLLLREIEEQTPEAHHTSNPSIRLHGVVLNYIPGITTTTINMRIATKRGAFARRIGLRMRTTDCRKNDKHSSSHVTRNFTFSKEYMVFVLQAFGTSRTSYRQTLVSPGKLKIIHSATT
jgi:hypothetical protein